MLKAGRREIRMNWSFTPAFEAWMGFVILYYMPKVTLSLEWYTVEGLCVGEARTKWGVRNVCKWTRPVSVPSRGLSIHIMKQDWPPPWPRRPCVALVDIVVLCRTNWRGHCEGYCDITYLEPGPLEWQVRVFVINIWILMLDVNLFCFFMLTDDSLDGGY